MFAKAFNRKKTPHAVFAIYDQHNLNWSKFIIPFR